MEYYLGTSHLKIEEIKVQYNRTYVHAELYRRIGSKQIC